jgi:predicted Abi (CAAX) family protease
MKLRSRALRRSLQFLLLLLMVVVAIVGFHPVSQSSPVPDPLPPSQYSSTVKAPFNQPSYYPAAQAPPSNLYRPAGDWVGRLILPSEAEYQQVAKAQQETDWTWLEIYAAPAKYKAFIGKTVRLGWTQDPVVQNYVRLATRDVRFTSAAEKNFQSGIIAPIRLNGRNQVGPLQSLAGGHPFDDIEVVLKGEVMVEGGQGAGSGGQEKVAGESSSVTRPPSSANDQGQRTKVSSEIQNSKFKIQSFPSLRVSREPFMNTGRFVALVKYLEPVPPKDPKDLPRQCPGDPPCTSSLMRVQHYNPATGQFDGKQEVIQIPQQPPDNHGVFNMTTRDLAQSPAGKDGWYIYGAKNKAGIFTVQAMQPRSLLLPKPQQLVLGFNEGLKYINFGSWKNYVARQGTLQTVLIDAKAKSPEAAQADWKVGDRVFAMHLYGGRGGTGPNHESYILGTYAGHFSFGLGEMVTDPFTNQPILDYAYLQVFGNGGDGTLSGGNTWSNYLGNLQRGFVSTRPISDVLIKLDTLTVDYNFGGTQLSFYNELLMQLHLVGARYRIGDGTGNSTITSATSCVQDSAQALFMTLRRFREKIEQNPELVQWMAKNPTHPTTVRFRKLVKLAQDLKEQVAPMGVVRWDWEHNAEVLTGVGPQQQFISIDNFQIRNLLTGLISWRTAMPRQANDELAMLFLNNGATLWFLRPNIIGGKDPLLAPLEPTLLLGAWTIPGTQIPLLSYLVIRTFGGGTIPSGWNWLQTLGVVVGFAAIAFPLGASRGLFSWEPWQVPWYRQLGWLLRLFFVPALLQEYIFRVLLLPYPREWVPAWSWWSWALLSLGLFVGFQLLYARFVCRSRYPLFSKPLILILYTLLGFACTIAYWLTSSLWTITVIHWLVMSAWILVLGGMRQLHQDQRSRYSKLYGR